MKKALLALSVLIFACASLPAQNSTQNDTVEKRKFRFHIETKKEIKKERDSLRDVVRILKLQIDSLCAFEDMVALPDTLEECDTLHDSENAEDFEYRLASDSVSRDSLLSVWYYKNSPLIDMEPYNIDSLDFTSDIPDSVYLERLKMMNSFISLPYNKRIRNHIIYYTQKIPTKMEQILGLANYYMPIIEEILDSYDLPLELKAMAVIESALNPKARSRANAKGMWQFIYGTARKYNLTINSYIDERYDPIKATHAAAQYLKDSYMILGDWALAIASYNCGISNVNKAIRRSGGSKEFWEIYPYLPRETRGYVPSFFAALYTMTYYKEHNLKPKEIAMPPHVDTIAVNQMLHFEQVAHFTGISVEELRTHNPQYLHDIIPGGKSKQYILRIPYNYTDKFVENENEIYTYKDSVYFNPGVLKKIQEGGLASADRIVHRVRKGETLSHIAQRYRVSVRNLKRWNGIGTRIRVGQRIVIYKNGKGPSASKSSSSSKKTTTSTSTSTSGGYVYYTVKKGDNLWDIANKFKGVTVNDILKINGFTKRTRIYPNQKIKIKKAN